MHLAQSNQIGKLPDLKATIVSAPAASNGSGKNGLTMSAKFGSASNSPTPVVSVSIAPSNVLSMPAKSGDAEMANDLMQADGQLAESKPNFTMSIKTPTLQQHLLRKSPIEAKNAIASQS